MTSITVPIGNIHFEYGANGLAPNPEQWLSQVIEQAEYVLTQLPKLEKRAKSLKLDWPASISKDCRVAHQSAESALQAISDDDPNTAMLATFHAGRAIEKATAALAVFGGLKFIKEGKKKGGDKRGEQVSAEKEKNKEFVIYVFDKMLTDQEKREGILIEDWIKVFKKIAKYSPTKGTMKTWLGELGYPYKKNQRGRPKKKTS